MKDELYDFGFLGKWSAVTLKAQAHLHPSDSDAIVPTIEKLYNTKLELYVNHMSRNGNKRLKKDQMLYEVYDMIHDMIVVDNKKMELQKQYDNYRSVLNKILFGEK